MSMKTTLIGVLGDVTHVANPPGETGKTRTNVIVSRQVTTKNGTQIFTQRATIFGDNNPLHNLLSAKGNQNVVVELSGTIRAGTPYTNNQTGATTSSIEFTANTGEILWDPTFVAQQQGPAQAQQQVQPQAQYQQPLTNQAIPAFGAQQQVQYQQPPTNQPLTNQAIPAFGAPPASTETTQVPPNWQIKM